MINNVHFILQTYSGLSKVQFVIVCGTLLLLAMHLHYNLFAHDVLHERRKRIVGARGHGTVH
jgi:hypothetical protein